MGILSRLLGGEEDENETVEVKVEAFKFPSLTRVEVNYADGTSEKFTYYSEKKDNGVRRYYEPTDLRLRFGWHGNLKTKVQTELFKEVSMANVKSIDVVDDDRSMELYAENTFRLDRDEAEDWVEAYSDSDNRTVEIEDDE